MENLKSVLDAMVAAHEALAAKQSACEAKLLALEEVVNKQIVGTIKRLYEDDLFDEFSTKHSEKFAPWREDLDLLYGDQYSMKSIYDKFKGAGAEDDESFVNGLIQEIEAKLKKLKGIVDAAPEAPVEVVATEAPVEAVTTIVDGDGDGKVDTTGDGEENATVEEAEAKDADDDGEIDWEEVKPEGRSLAD